MTYKLLLETSNPADIAMVKSLLNAEGILHFVQGEAFNTVRPLIEPARFMVAEDRLDDAMELIRTLQLSYGPMTSTTSEKAGEASSDD